ncbi:MAG: orotidine-5'-phosphate decarboxylase [Candidatus Omnitrophota bacterium]|nr:orotidine-5'-phosphate decarboxylase [Candidatus Omnitrophota bacterium]
MKAKNRLIIALDFDHEDKALRLVDALKGEVSLFKVGSELFTSSGPAVIKKIRDMGGEVFLDLKFHDIPNTAAKAAVAAARLGAFIFNVHALGGYEMMKKAAESAAEEAGRLNMAKPKVIAVTILTSTDEKALRKIGINDKIEKIVLKLAGMAKEAGLDGVVASPHEARLIRKKLGRDFLIVTPGIRPAWAPANDQKRIATPREAIEAGADYIVVGRPVSAAKDPLAAAKSIREEIA